MPKGPGGPNSAGRPVATLLHAYRFYAATQRRSVMSIRSMLVAAAFALACLETAQADGLRPIDAMSIDLGEVSGVAYYTVERDGFHVVTTLHKAWREGRSGSCLFLHRVSV